MLQGAGHAALHGPEQPSALPDDLRQGHSSKAAGQTQTVERADGDQPGGAENQAGERVELLDHQLYVRCFFRANKHLNRGEKICKIYVK